MVQFLIKYKKYIYEFNSVFIRIQKGLILNYEISSKVKFELHPLH